MPNQKVIDDYVRHTRRLIEYHEELVVATNGKRRQVSLEKMLSEQFVMLTCPHS